VLFLVRLLKKCRWDVFWRVVAEAFGGGVFGEGFLVRFLMVFEGFWGGWSRRFFGGRVLDCFFGEVVGEVFGEGLLVTFLGSVVAEVFGGRFLESGFRFLVRVVAEVLGGGGWRGTVGEVFGKVFEKGFL
jgi:hypothetical protein